MSLAAYGWNQTWAHRLAAAAIPDGQPARVIAEHRDRFVVRTADGERSACVAGRMRHTVRGRSDLPAVGDWVVVADGHEEPTIHAVLPRVSKFSRQAAGRSTDEQVIAANVDTVWIVSALDADLNPARIERYLTMVWESGASPVVVLTKADLVERPDDVAEDLTARLPGVPVHAVSTVHESSLDKLLRYIPAGQTIALVGSSGVGKSTLVNHFAGRDSMAVREVRSYDGKGRHTTTHRELILLPSGGLLLDTPGMRELQLWSAGNGLEATFDDIAALASDCRFRDCQHDSEPGCAVHAAIEAGALEMDRLESYRKLERELAYAERKIDVHAALEEKRQIKRVMKEYRRGLRPDS